MTFARVKLSAAARGYGKDHQAERDRRVAAFTPGDPCCLCRHPMYGPTRDLDLDHLPGTNQYRGLAHGTTSCPTCGERCNRTDAARRAREQQNVTRLRW